MMQNRRGIQLKVKTANIGQDTFFSSREIVENCQNLQRRITHQLEKSKSHDYNGLRREYLRIGKAFGKSGLQVF